MMKTIVRKIGLVAHDAMKKDMIEWVLWNSEHLIGHKFYCTGTTGTLIKKALEEKHPETEWDITILKSGPLGGEVSDRPARRDWAMPLKVDSQSPPQCTGCCWPPTVAERAYRQALPLP